MRLFSLWKRTGLVSQALFVPTRNSEIKHLPLGEQAVCQKATTV